jgi:hypothetical protein
MTEAKTKEVTIDGKDYLIGLFSPMVGSMLILQMPQVATSETVYGLVRNNVLNVLSIIETHGEEKIPVKVFTKVGDSGKWTRPEFETTLSNPVHFNKVMGEVLSFNLDRFFEEKSPQEEVSTTVL